MHRWLDQIEHERKDRQRRQADHFSSATRHARPSQVVRLVDSLADRQAVCATTLGLFIQSNLTLAHLGHVFEQEEEEHLLGALAAPTTVRQPRRPNARFMPAPPRRAVTKVSTARPALGRSPRLEDVLRASTWVVKSFSS